MPKARANGIYIRYKIEGQGVPLILISSEVLANTIPNARPVRVEGGAHAFFVEMRSRFNKKVLDFLN
jgi:hypothetical protein